MFIDKNGEGPGIPPYFFVGARFYIEDKVGSVMRLLTNNYGSSAPSGIVPARVEKVISNSQRANDLHNVSKGVRDLGLSYLALTISSAVVASGGATIPAGMLSGEIAMPKSVALAIGRAIDAGKLSYGELLKLSIKYPDVAEYILRVIAVKTGTHTAGPLDPRAPLDDIAFGILNGIWDFVPKIEQNKDGNSEPSTSQEKNDKALEEASDLDEGTYVWDGDNWVKQ